jgi:hypothetical protein
MGIDPKSLILKALFGRWGRTAPIEGGYSILLPTPSDMPFLLRFALEGLKHLDLENCRQVIVLGDGCTDDAGLRRVVEQSGVPRVEMAAMGPVPYFFVHKMGRPGGEVANWTHWAMIIEGTRRSRGEYVFLHDADAFFLDARSLERQYRECLERKMVSLGVTARNDPFFHRHGRTIPGTWELMFSNRWARSHAPIDHKGRLRSTPMGVNEFDTMLYPQFMREPVDSVGVIDPPPRLVHFAGAITTYRTFRDRAGSPVVDEIFRLLLLALLEDLVPDSGSGRVLMTVDELARGLSDSSAPVTYGSPVAVQEYPIFRRMIEDLCESPVMGAGRAGRLRELLRPFDDHFAVHKADPGLGSLIGHRRDGLG